MKKTQDDLLRTIAAIHSAGADESLWPEALASLAGIFGSAGATIEAADRKTLALTDFWAHGIPSACEIAYAEHYISISPRVPYGAQLTPGQVFFDYRVLSEAEMDRDAYYAEFLPQGGLRYFVAANLIQSPDEYAAVAVQRSRREGHIQKQQVELFARLAPHIRQAYDVTRRLRTSQRREQALKAALDWLNDGVLLIGTNGAVLHANAAAQDFARRGDGVAITRSVFDISSSARAAFDRALEAIRRQKLGEQTLAAALDFVLIRGGGKSPYLCSVRPVQLPERRHASGHDVLAIVFIRDPYETRDSVDTRMIREAFGLTEAEAHLALALGSGVQPAQYARERGISPNTVYTHLRRIKEKTAAEKMIDLVLKLSALSPPLKGG